MTRIPLSGKHGAGLFVLVDDEDFVLVSGRSWHISQTKNNKYARCSYWENGKVKNKKMHHFILPIEDGYDLMVDHINGNGLDNRKINLRYVTVAGNTQNRGASSNSKSGVRGVYWSKGTLYANGSWKVKPSWVASIRANGKPLFLGHFKDKQDAVNARKDAETIHYIL